MHVAHLESAVWLETYPPLDQVLHDVIVEITPYPTIF
jgi:hypothetical protein